MDLTELSSTMVYSEVFNMLSSPDQYVRKTVKLDGIAAFYHDEATDKYYYACIIQDATACCAQGIEYVLAENTAGSDDYPEAGTDISVVGTFDTYEEGGTTYCTLKEASLV